MAVAFRTISGALGVVVLLGTALLAIKLLVMEQDASVLLAAYMGIGGLLFGAFLLIYAITGKWHPKPGVRRNSPAPNEGAAARTGGRTRGNSRYTG